MISYFKGWYNGIFVEIPQGETADECFFIYLIFCVYVCACVCVVEIGSAHS